MNNVKCFVGDRFFCISKKNEFISSLSKKDEYEVKMVEEEMSSNDLYVEIKKKTLFGTNNQVFVFDNTFPTPEEDMEMIFRELPKNKHLVFIFDKISKATKFGKIIADIMEEYPDMYTDKGFVDKKLVEKAKKQVKETVKWTGSEECLDLIFEKTDYVYGSIISEIDKISTYLGKHPKDVHEILDIISNNDVIRFDTLIKSIMNRNLVHALDASVELSESDEFEEEYLLFFNGLIDNLNFTMYHLMSIESGIKDIDGISQFISENYFKGKNKTPAQMIKGRFFFMKDYAKHWNLVDIQHALKKAECALDACLYKRANQKFIINNLLVSII